MLLCKNMRDSRGFCSCHVACSRNRMWQMSVRGEIQPQMDSVGTNVIIRRLLCTRTKLMMTSGCTGVNPNTPASCHSRPLTKRPGGRIRAGLSSKASRTALWRSRSITWKMSKGSWYPRELLIWRLNDAWLRKLFPVSVCLHRSSHGVNYRLQWFPDLSYELRSVEPPGMPWRWNTCPGDKIPAVSLQTKPR